MNKRRTIQVPGLQHENPIPMASQIGPFLMTGAIFGQDPETGRTPPDAEGQCALVFANARRILEAAGGSIDDIIKMTVWLTDKSDRIYVNEQWLTMFPDPESRPARHTLVLKELAGGYQVLCEITAILSGLR